MVIFQCNPELQEPCCDSSTKCKLINNMWKTNSLRYFCYKTSNSFIFMTYNFKNNTGSKDDKFFQLKQAKPVILTTSIARTTILPVVTSTVHVDATIIQEMVQIAVQVYPRTVKQTNTAKLKIHFAVMVFVYASPAINKIDLQQNVYLINFNVRTLITFKHFLLFTIYYILKIIII